MPGNAPGSYDIPQEMREFAEKSVEQARKAFDGFVGAAHRTVSEMAGPAGSAASGPEDIGRKAIAFAETNVAAGFAYARRLVQARDVTEVMQIQSDFLRDQMKVLSEQARELGTAMTPGSGNRRGWGRLP